MEAANLSKSGKIDPKKIAALVGGMLGSGYRPSDDDPPPIGPWGPVMRLAVALAHPSLFGPRPEPWRGAAAGYANGDVVALNPQPLPPRALAVIALGRAAILRAELLGEAAAFAGHAGGAERYMLDLIDDWCGTPPRKFPWPRPGPRPDWAREALGALDHLILASVIDEAIGGFGGGFAEGLGMARNRLVDAAAAGLAR
jgi:hypothetical protein